MSRADLLGDARGLQEGLKLSGRQVSKEEEDSNLKMTVARSERGKTLRSHYADK